jgi:hypothetical protein
MPDDSKEIVITGKYADDGGSGMSYYMYELQRSSAFYMQPDFTQIASVVFSEAASQFKTIRVDTDKGPVRVKIDTTGMNDEQIGAIAKLLENFAKDPDTRRVFERIAVEDETRKYSSVELIFRYDDKILAFDETTKTFKLESFSNARTTDHKGEITSGTLSNGNVVVYVNINKDKTAGNIHEFSKTATHEIFHLL